MLNRRSDQPVLNGFFMACVLVGCSVEEAANPFGAELGETQSVGSEGGANGAEFGSGVLREGVVLRFGKERAKWSSGISLSDPIREGVRMATYRIDWTSEDPIAFATVMIKRTATGEVIHSKKWDQFAQQQTGIWWMGHCEEGPMAITIGPNQNGRTF